MQSRRDGVTSDAIKQEVINTINRFEPRVRLTGVRVQPRYDRNTFNVTIVFKIVGIPINETIEFVLQRPE